MIGKQWLGGEALAAACALGAAACAVSQTPTCDAAKPCLVSLHAVPANTFLDTLGVNIHVAQGYPAASYVGPLRYLGVRLVRDGERRPDTLLALARTAHVKVMLVITGDLGAYLATARQFHAAGTLLAVEGPNEPNNFPLTYQGQKGGGPGGDWRPVAVLQRDLYARVKGDAALADVPVLGPSEVGGETSDVGLQFLRTPFTVDAIMPGVAYADFANVHNYVSAVRGGYGDNQAWQAADPTLRGRWDGLAGAMGRTWYRGYAGYDDAALVSLPRATTETGWNAGADPASQRHQGVVLVNTYLAQFARGWHWTFIYELRDNEGGASTQGLFTGDHPKLAADYIHNLTALLADTPAPAVPDAETVQLAFTAPTAHALLLRKASGEHDLVIWGEKVTGTTHVTVHFLAPTSGAIFDVTTGTKPIAGFSARREVAVDVTDHAVILRY